MSTTQTNLDIDRRNVSGYCDLKCTFSFKYPETNLTARNQGNYLQFTLDQTNATPVLFNNQKYTPRSFGIYAPSILKFNGNRTSAQLIINHTPQNGGARLAVCIPIITANSMSAATEVVTDLINRAARSVPRNGNSSNLNMSNFTLQPLVPMRPFYNYVSADNTIYIVFDYLDAITLSTATIDKFKQIITPYTDSYLNSQQISNLVGYKTGELIYNSKGPTKGYIGDGIYISCRPTGSSVEDSPVLYDTPSSSSGGYTFFNFDISRYNYTYFIQLFIMIITGSLLFIIIVYLISFFYGYLNSDKSFIEYIFSIMPKFRSN